MRTGVETDKESSRGFIDLEGYLRWNAELREARGGAARFTGQLPWLTAGQREDVERIYITERVTARKKELARITGRAAELREEYARRYVQLKRRCVATVVVASGAMGGGCVIAVFFGRG